ncbi:MAG: hypothetical protein QNJ90_01160 [Planctomycetota bacterium]|nr:hypothetical protein [Planctomycetota bacterium]
MRAPPTPALIAGLPPLAALVAAPLTASGAEGVFQTDVVGLVAVVGVAGFAVRVRRAHLLALLAAALLLGGVHLAAGGALAGAPKQVLLACGVGLAASGLAALGRTLGTPALTAGSAAVAVLFVAMTGLVWADDIAEELPRSERFAFRQAVLHLDPATACAFDVAGFDRFHSPLIYRRVQLTTSAVRAPDAVPTGLAWLVFGAVAWGAAAGLRFRRESRS